MKVLFWVLAVLGVLALVWLVFAVLAVIGLFQVASWEEESGSQSPARK